jgi:Tfp pilus assembly protein PilE
MKAQVAVEMLLVIAIFLGVITPIFYFSFTQSVDEIRTAKAKYALDEIAKAADYVYSLETGTTTQLQIELPDGIDEARIVGKTIVYKVSTTSGITDIFSVSKADLSGTLPIKSTKHILTLSHTEDGVKIG